jgi:Uma2 family endonuclease
MAMTTVQRMTFNDLMAQPDDDYLNELVRGEILRMPPPKEDHGCVEAALVEAIGRYLDDRALALGWEKSQGRAARNRLVGRLLSGDVGVRFSLPDDPDQLRGLDVCYLSAEQVARLGAVPTAEYLVGMPALVAEVISPSETASYINEKVNDLLRGGAQLVWLFYPKTRTVMVLRPDGSARMIPAGGLLDGNDVLPGFMVELASIFA